MAVIKQFKLIFHNTTKKQKRIKHWNFKMSRKNFHSHLNIRRLRDHF